MRESISCHSSRMIASNAYTVIHTVEILFFIVFSFAFKVANRGTLAKKHKKQERQGSIKQFVERRNNNFRMEFSSRHSSPGSDNFNSRDGTLNISGSVREEQEERQRLEKQNFDLKMKVYYMEEASKKQQNGEQRPHGFSATSLAEQQYADKLRSEVSDLKLQLEEKQLELEQRNMLLLKAKNAIEALKAELERQRNEFSRQEDLEDRVRRLKQINEEMDADYGSQLTQLQAELKSAKQIIDLREQQSLDSEVKLANSLDRFKELTTEKEAVEERWLNAQQTISNLEEELTQCRAHVELYKLQLDEESREKDELVKKLKEAHSSKSRTDEDSTRRFNELNAQYETSIQNMRTSHEQEMERTRASHLKMMAEARESHNKELDRAKEGLEEKVQGVKEGDARELQRIKDDYTGRLSEKNEELRVMRALLDGDRSRADVSTHELEVTRAELLSKTDQIEKQKNEISNHLSELRIIPDLKKALRDCETKLASARQQLDRETQLRIQAGAQVTQLGDALDSCREDVRRKEEALSACKTDLSRLNKESTEYSNRMSGIETVSRENERMKATHGALQLELLEAKHQVVDQKKDCERLREEISKLNIMIANFEAVQKENKSFAESAKSERESLHRELQSVRERAGAADAALKEQRDQCTALRSDLEQERAKHSQYINSSTTALSEVQELRESLGVACNMAYEAMLKWDRELTLVLEGSDAEEQSYGRPFHASSTVSSTRHSSYSRSPIHGFYESGTNNMQAFLLGSSSSSSSSSISLDEPSSHNYNQRHNGSRLSSAANTVHHHHHASYTPDMFMKDVAVRIERVQLKMDRAKRLRSTFEVQAANLLNSSLTSFDSAQDKASLLMHKVTDARNALSHIQNVMTRDKKMRETELDEMKSFREVLLGEHTAQLRDSEQRFSAVTLQWEQERERGKQSAALIHQQREEINSLLSQCRDLKSDLEELSKTESTIMGLVGRVDELAAMNKSLTADVEKHVNMVANCNNEVISLREERASLNAEVDTLTFQALNREDVIQEYEGKMARFVKEIERLRARQINPELAQTILETQSILQSSTRGGSAHLETRGQTPTNRRHQQQPQQQSPGAAALLYGVNSANDVTEEYLQRIGELLVQTDVLVTRSTDAIAKFEDVLHAQQPSHRSDEGSSSEMMSQTASTRALTSRLRNLEHDVYELLDMNAKVASDAKGLCSDVELTLRRSLQKHNDYSRVAIQRSSPVQRSPEQKAYGAGYAPQPQHTSRRSERPIYQEENGRSISRSSVAGFSMPETNKPTNVASATRTNEPARKSKALSPTPTVDKGDARLEYHFPNRQGLLQLGTPVSLSKEIAESTEDEPYSSVQFLSATATASGGESQARSAVAGSRLAAVDERPQGRSSSDFRQSPSASSNSPDHHHHTRYTPSQNMRLDDLNVSKRPNPASATSGGDSGASSPEAVAAAVRANVQQFIASAGSPGAGGYQAANSGGSGSGGGSRFGNAVSGTRSYHSQRTPRTDARYTATTLSRLGAELQTLAHKLDAFDHRGTK